LLTFVQRPDGTWEKQPLSRAGWDYLVLIKAGQSLGDLETHRALKLDHDAIEGNFFEKSAWVFFLENRKWRKVCSSD